MSVRVTIPQPTAAAFGRVLLNSAPSASPEARIEAFEKSIAEIYSEIDRDRSVINQKFGDISTELEKESHAGIQSISMANQKLIASQLSNLSNSLIGAVWLIVGVANDTF